jgi:glycosyltransferase involved in cell wall biosynthesis
MVFPSATETFGNVVLESMACGTPVIGANAGGVKNIISNTKNGLLCTPKCPHEFANAIHSLLEDQDALQRMGIATRHYALSQSWDNIFTRLVNEYAEMLAHQGVELFKANG